MAAKLKQINEEFKPVERQETDGWVDRSHPRPRIGKTRKDKQRKGLI
jgi:hypothetical protein